jgi:hypothetical protein
MSPGEFFNEMTELCAQAGIPVEEEAGCVYLANVQLVPLMATQKGLMPVRVRPLDTE